MLIKAGVDISRLGRNTRKSLTILEGVWKFHGEEMIITSAFEGNHSAGSLHYANQAYDIRYPNDDHAFWHLIAENHLGKDFDIVQEVTHLHVEYDPK